MIVSAIEDLQDALVARLKARMQGVLSSPDGAVVQLARTFVARHLRPTEYGIEDVEAHWRELPPPTRQAFLDAMHAPARPELQTPDRPEARALKDLPPGLQAVYEAVQQDVGARKYAALQAKVEAGGGNPYERKAGYLKGRESRPLANFYNPDEKTAPEEYDREDLKMMAEATDSPEAWALYDEYLDASVNNLLEELGYAGPVPRTRAGKEMALDTGQPDLAVEAESQMGYDEEVHQLPTAPGYGTPLRPGDPPYARTPDGEVLKVLGTDIDTDVAGTGSSARILILDDPIHDRAGRVIGHRVEFADLCTPVWSKPPGQA